MKTGRQRSTEQGTQFHLEASAHQESLHFHRGFKGHKTKPKMVKKSFLVKLQAKTRKTITVSSIQDYEKVLANKTAEKDERLESNKLLLFMNKTVFRISKRIHR